MADKRFDTCDGFDIGELLDYEKIFLKTHATNIIGSEFLCLDDAAGEQLICSKTIKNVPLDNIDMRRAEHYSIDDYSEDEIRNVETSNQIRLTYDPNNMDEEVGTQTIDRDYKHPRLERLIENMGDVYFKEYLSNDLRRIKLAEIFDMDSILAEVNECIVHVVEPVKADTTFKEIRESRKLRSAMQELNSKTKQTGLEHGMKFCKMDDEIVVDNVCVGSECSIFIQPKICGSKDHDFHTHPSGNSESSLPDMYSNALQTYWRGSPHIKCIKGTDTASVTCSRIRGIPTDDDMSRLKDIYTEYNNGDPTYSASQKGIREIEQIINIVEDIFVLGYK